MTVAITIRNVPDDIRDELAARAARSGRSLQEFLRDHLIDVAARPSAEDVIRRARERAHTSGQVAVVDDILHDLAADRR